MLFHVYAEPKPEGYYDPATEPFGIYRQILDADWLLYILLPFLAILVVVGLMIAWHIHEMPKHKADHKKMRQSELVTALTLLGLFEHWVWAVALFIAYMDWNATEDWLVNILRRSRQVDDPATAAMNASATATSITPGTQPPAPPMAPPLLAERVEPALPTATIPAPEVKS